jgi:hypothetical protein
MSEFYNYLMSGTISELAVQQAMPQQQQQIMTPQQIAAIIPHIKDQRVLQQISGLLNPIYQQMQQQQAQQQQG